MLDGVGRRLPRRDFAERLRELVQRVALALLELDAIGQVGIGIWRLLSDGLGGGVGGWRGGREVGGVGARLRVLIGDRLRRELTTGGGRKSRSRQIRES